MDFARCSLASTSFIASIEEFWSEVIWPSFFVLKKKNYDIILWKRKNRNRNNQQISSVVSYMKKHHSFYLHLYSGSSRKIRSLCRVYNPKPNSVCLEMGKRFRSSTIVEK